MSASVIKRSSHWPNVASKTLPDEGEVRERGGKRGETVGGKKSAREKVPGAFFCAPLFHKPGVAGVVAG